MNHRRLNLYCFSPPVMLATFAIEIGLASYVLWRYHMSRVTRLATGMLVLLATFQLAEYMVCGGMGMNAGQWSRIGFAAITMLPPLGIHLVFALAGKYNRAIIGAGYAVAAAFAAFFLLAPSGISGNQCMGNYVIFQMHPAATALYGWYYYGLLFVGVGLSWWLSRTAKPRVAKALHAFAVGYVLFMLPTTTANIIDPATVAGNPSIMCGFAVLFALVLARWVLPSVAREKRDSAARQLLR